VDFSTTQHDRKSGAKYRNWTVILVLLTLFAPLYCRANYITSSPNPSVYGSTVTISISGGPPFSGTVTFYSNGSSIGSTSVSGSGGSASFSTSSLPVGSDVITAVWSYYAGSNQTANFSGLTQTVRTASQTINFPAPASPVTYGVAPITLSATASSGLPVSYIIMSGPGSISGNTLTFTGAGTVEVEASQAGNTTYAPASPVAQSVVVNPATPTVSAWPTASGITYGQSLASSTLTGGTASVAGVFYWTTTVVSLNAGTSSHSVTFMPGASQNYNSVAGSVNVTVAKATPTVTAWPTASGITYGQTLASSTLSGGTFSIIGGTFAWTSPSTVPNAGTSWQSVTLTPTDTTDYNIPASGSVSVAVAKATPSVSAWPTASNITYGQTLASSSLTGGTATVAGSFAWTIPSTVPLAGTSSQAVTFTPTDTTDYNIPSSGSTNVTVAKATLSVSAWPTASGITYGQTLASSTLTGGTASVAGTFAWTTPSTVPNAGTSSQSVTFTPSDTTDYNIPASGSVSVAVAKATPSVSAWPTASNITYGQILASSSLTGGTASVAGGFAWTTPSTVPNAGTSSQGVTFTPTDTVDYNIPASGSSSVTVAKATPSVSAWPTASNITYGQTLASSSLTGGTASVAGSFAWTTPTTAPGAGTASQSVTFTPSVTANYNTVHGSVTVTVAKATPTISAWPTAGGITYGQTLASSTLTGGTASVAGGFAWTTPSTVPNAGTSSQGVTFTPTDTTDYNIPASGSSSVTVAKATPTVSAWPAASNIT
jgi:hypothetical protein